MLREPSRLNGLEPDGDSRLPNTFAPVAQIQHPFELVEPRMVRGIDDAHVELFVVLRVTAQCVLGNLGADQLFVIGVNEHAIVHVDLLLPGVPARGHTLSVVEGV